MSYRVCWHSLISGNVVTGVTPYSTHDEAQANANFCIQHFPLLVARNPEPGKPTHWVELVDDEPAASETKEQVA